MKTLEEIERRKALLVARTAIERAQLAAIYTQIERPVRLGENIFRFFRKPLVLTGVAALLLKTPWKRYAKLPAFLWRVWQFTKIFRHARG